MVKFASISMNVTLIHVTKMRDAEIRKEVTRAFVIPVLLEMDFNAAEMVVGEHGQHGVIGAKHVVMPNV